MSRVVGFHVIGCTYGFWLPNDERGSGSDFVRTDALTRFGPANPVSHRRSVARKPFNRQVRALAKQSLRYPPVIFNDAQINACLRGYAREIEEFRAAPMYAFAQLRNHFHFVCGPCRYDIRRFTGRLRGAATKQLLAEGIHPFQRFPVENGELASPWSVKPWIVYLFNEKDVIRSIRYTENNLRRERLPIQDLRFVAEFLSQPTVVD